MAMTAVFTVTVYSPNECICVSITLKRTPHGLKEIIQHRNYNNKKHAEVYVVHAIQLKYCFYRGSNFRSIYITQTYFYC